MQLRVPSLAPPPSHRFASAHDLPHCAVEEGARWLYYAAGGSHDASSFSLRASSPFSRWRWRMSFTACARAASARGEWPEARVKRRGGTHLLQEGLRLLVVQLVLAQLLRKAFHQLLGQL